MNREIMRMKLSGRRVFFAAVFAVTLVASGIPALAAGSASRPYFAPIDGSSGGGSMSAPGG